MRRQIYIVSVVMAVRATIAVAQPAQSTVYGVGALLLAGSEVYALAK